jgi:hypothetical protein
LPALFLAGVDPIQRDCNEQVPGRVGNCFCHGDLCSQRTYRVAKAFLVICGFMGGASGALLVSSIDKRYLEVCVPIMLILVAIYFALSPKLANEDRRKRIGILLFSFTLAPILGFYDGIFGPGVGSFFIVGFVLLCGLGMMRAMSFTTGQRLLQSRLSFDHNQRRDHLASGHRHGFGSLRRRATGCQSRCSSRSTTDQTHVDRGLLRLGHQAAKRRNQPLAHCGDPIAGLVMIISITEFPQPITAHTYKKP